MNNIHSFKVVAFVILSVVSAYAQPDKSGQIAVGTGEATKTRTELLNELSLRTAQVDLEHAKKAYERYEREYQNSHKLFEESILSKKELDEALSAYARSEQQLKQAKIQLEKTKLSFLDKASHITIMEAKKYYDTEGKRMLDVVLKNTSNLAQAESALGLDEDQSQSGWQSPKQIQALLNIENIIVSVVDNLSSIGKPYEQIIHVLPYGQEMKLTFALLTDVQQVGVKMQFLDQDVTEKIFLEKESLQKYPTVISSQFSQEGQLGTDIHYDLDLEMLVTSNVNFSMAVTNMLPQINCSFVDSNSSARITSVRFTEDVSKHDLDLKVSIPQKLDVDMIDKKTDFQIWVATSKQVEAINKLKRQYPTEPIPFEKLEKIEAARVDLVLIPKGAGRLEILINNLYTEIKPQQNVNIKADIHNAGTLDLFDIMPEVSQPLGWTAKVQPKAIVKLAPGDKKSIEIQLLPGSDVRVGEYEAQIETRGQSGSEIIEALEKRLKIRIIAETHIATTLILVLVLVGLIGTIIVFGIKLCKR